MSVGRPFLVVSDIHIGAVSAETERAFRAFLRYAGETAAGLVINGDLFDVWIPSRRFVLRPYVRVLAQLAELVEQGLPVHFVGGNHDAQEYSEPVLREDIGVTVLGDPARLQLGPFSALVAHGDGVGLSSGPYRKENAVLRWLLIRAGVRSIVARIASEDWLYERVSGWSRVPGIVARQSRGEGTGPKPDAHRVESWAREQLRRFPDIDLVLSGHAHLPALAEVEPGRFYINTGDWIEHMSYAWLPADRGSPEIRRWPDRAVILPPPRTASTTLGDGLRDKVDRA
jgi:UDP-2,3-diacylglucosamine hydrolase